MSRRDYIAHKETARKIVHERLAHFAPRYHELGHPEPLQKLSRVGGRISVRNQRSRWGSCSRSGNLNFNYRIASLRPELQDYIVVHELCHLKEFNHKEGFWALVALTVPDWQALRAELRAIATQ